MNTSTLIFERLTVFGPNFVITLDITLDGIIRRTDRVKIHGMNVIHERNTWNERN